MFKRYKAYTIVCNGCGCELEMDNGVNIWHSEADAEDAAIDADWLVDVDNGKHYCQDCQVWDEERDEFVPKVLNNQK